MNNNVFAKIPKRVFSVISNDKWTNEGSLLDLTNDKIIIVLYELQVGSDFRGVYRNSLEGFINNCGYKTNKRETLESFIDLLKVLNEQQIINLNCDKLSKKTLLTIDTDEVYNLSSCENGYVQLYQWEIDEIRKITNQNKQFNNLLKTYLWIKNMCYKREYNNLSGLQGEHKPQSVTMDYEYISKYTKNTVIDKTIKILKKAKMIDYSNFLIAPINNKKAVTESKNTYVVRALEENNSLELMNEELELAIRQYKYELSKNNIIF